MIEENRYTVYRHTCPNGQYYIGITCQEPEKRWGKDGKNYFESWFWRQGISLFGWNNIKHEILITGLSKPGAEIAEIDLIAQHNSWVPGRGYNDRIGTHRRPTYPVRDLQTNKVYYTKKACMSDVRSEQWLKENPRTNGGTFRGRLQDCTPSNACDSDIYVLNKEQRTCFTPIDILRAKALAEIANETLTREYEMFQKTFIEILKENENGKRIY